MNKGPILGTGTFKGGKSIIKFRRKLIVWSIICSSLGSHDFTLLFTHDFSL